jgi:hypothetical protein
MTDSDLALSGLATYAQGHIVKRGPRRWSARASWPQEAKLP